MTQNCLREIFRMGGAKVKLEVEQINRIAVTIVKDIIAHKYGWHLVKNVFTVTILTILRRYVAGKTCQRV